MRLKLTRKKFRTLSAKGDDWQSHMPRVAKEVVKLFQPHLFDLCERVTNIHQEGSIQVQSGGRQGRPLDASIAFVKNSDNELRVAIAPLNGVPGKVGASLYVSIKYDREAAIFKGSYVCDALDERKLVNATAAKFFYKGLKQNLLRELAPILARKVAALQAESKDRAARARALQSFLKV